MTENTNYIFEELFKAAQPNRGLFVMPLPTVVLAKRITPAR